MEKIFIITSTLIFLVSTSAFAEGYKCLSMVTGDTYILAIDGENEQATVLIAPEDKNQFENWQLLFTKGPVTRAMDSGPTSMRSPQPPMPNWEKEKNCYTAAAATRLTVNGNSGTLDRFMDIQTDPKVICNIPRFARGRTQELVCQNL